MGYLRLRYGPSLDLQVYPNLPPQIPYIRFPTFHFQGWPIEAEANQTHTTLKRTGKPLTTANPMFSSSSINVRLGRSVSDTIGTFQLAPGGVLVLLNVDSGANSSLGNNILQCRPVVSSEPSNSPGQFPQAAIDGTNSTVWLPAAGNNFSSLTVDLTSEIFYAVDYIFIEWPQRQLPMRLLYFIIVVTLVLLLAQHELTWLTGAILLMLAYQIGVYGLTATQPF
jgi:hypothetical protein